MKNNETSAIKETAKMVAKKFVKEIGNNWPADNCFFWSYCPQKPASMSEKVPTENVK